MHSKYKAIFYDWDGCIAKTIDIWLAAYKQVLAEENIHPKDEEIIALFGNWNAPKILGHSDLERATEKVLEIVHAKIDEVETYDASKDVIKALKEKGIKIAIVTSSKRKTICKTSAFKQLEEFVDLLITADDVQLHKPHPEVILQGLTKLNLHADEILMVGDSDKDLGAANNAGVDSALFAPSYNALFHNHEELRSTFNPTHIFRDHRGILDII